MTMDSFTPPDRRISYVIDQGTTLNLDQGPVEQTGNPLDIAVTGSAFIAVQTPGGERYTRNGALRVPVYDHIGNVVAVVDDVTTNTVMWFKSAGFGYVIKGGVYVFSKE